MVAKVSVCVQCNSKGTRIRNTYDMYSNHIMRGGRASEASED